MIRPDDINEDALEEFYHVVMRESDLAKRRGTWTDSNLDNLFYNAGEVSRLAKDGKIQEAKEKAAAIAPIFFVVE